MKKNIIYISLFLVLLFLLVIFSYLVMEYNNGSKYKFNDNVSFDDLINVKYEDKKDNICENCIFMVSYENSSSLLEVNDDEYEIIEMYDDNYVTNLDVGIGDSYKKVIAYYGINDNYAYWNVEFKNGDIYYYNYPNDIIDDKEIASAYLRFVYYLEDGKWNLLDASRAKKIDSLDINEYIMFTFEFAFNNNIKDVKDKTISEYSVYYKKN